jgi:hypothetical protein
MLFVTRDSQWYCLFSCSKEAEWGGHTNEQSRIGNENAAFGKEKQVFRSRKVIQAMEMEEKEKIGQIRSSFTM